MMDRKVLDKIAKTMCDYSVEVKKGDKVFILGWMESQPLVRALVDAVNERGASPYVVLSDDSVDAAILKNNVAAYEDHWKMYGEMMKGMDKMINIRSMDLDALAEAGDNAALKLGLMRNAYGNITKDKPWVLTNYPTTFTAKLFGKTMEEMEEFWGFATSFDYSTLEEKVKPLKELMNKTNKVQIKDAGTDLTFSIEGLDGIECIGTRNLPDGEVYTSPVKDSVNGYITYNQPTPLGKYVLTNVRFEFENGKIVKATCDGEEQTIALNKELDTDEGARYIGEFAIGFNPFIKGAVGDILFDEKMVGSFHFTPGQSYENAAYNGNNSKVHWDIVSCQLPEFGGGEIIFDDVVIRKDGQFVIDSLKALNADELTK